MLVVKVSFRTELEEIIKKSHFVQVKWYPWRSSETRATPRLVSFRVYTPATVNIDCTLIRLSLSAQISETFPLIPRYLSYHS